MSTTTSPNMGLTVPGVGSEPGPNWANEVNGDLSILDSHNHSNGQGVQIQPNGININSDLPFNGNDATLLRSTRYSPQLTPITNASPDVGAVYVSGNELYYNDVTGGHQVQITTNGSVNAGAGSITGLPSGTASASFSAGTFTWQAATSTPATMDMGTIIVRELVANGKGVTIRTVNALANNYNLTLPSANAAVANSFFLSDTSGNMSYAAVDGTTITNTGGTVAVGTIQTANIAAGAVTRPKQAAVGQQVSSSSGSFSTSSHTYVSVTNLSISITTSGRPIILVIQPDGTDLPTGSSIGNSSNSITAVALFNGISLRSCWTSGVGNATSAFFGASLMYVDVQSAGTYTYTVKAAAAAGNATVTNMVLMAYEL